MGLQTKTDCTMQWQKEHRAHGDLDSCESADILVLKLRCNKHSAYTERPTPPLVEEETLLLSTYMSGGEQKSWSWTSTRPKAKNDCAGKAQQQFNRPTDINCCSEGVASQRGQVQLSAEAVKRILGVESRYSSNGYMKT
jgi:hypothetical protein